MDLKQNYREETNLEVCAGTSEKYPSYSDKYVEWLEEQCIINGVSGSLFNEEPKLKALEIIKKQNFNYENAITYIDEILNFYRESYRNTGNKHYLNGLKYWNKIKYETQKEGDM